MSGPDLQAPRPAGLDIASVLEGGFRLVAKNWGVYLRTQGLVIVASQLPFLVAMAWMVDRLRTELGSSAQPAEEVFVGLLWEFGLVLAILLPVLWVLGLLAGFFGLTCTAALLEGGRPSLGMLWARFRGRFPAFLGASVLLGVLPFTVFVVPMVVLFAGSGAVVLELLALGVALLLVAAMVALYLALRWWLAPTVAVFEPRGAVDSLGVSARSTSGSILLLFVLLVLLALIAGAVGSALSSIVELAVPAPDIATPPEEAGTAELMDAALAAFGPTMLLQFAASSAVGLFFGPLWSAVMVLVYRALRAPPASPHGGTGAAPSFPPPPGVGPPVHHAPQPGDAPFLSSVGAGAAFARRCQGCGRAARPAAHACDACGAVLAA